MSASTGRVVRQHLQGELGELHEHLDAEDDGLALGLDALDRRAPAAGLLLHIYTANSCAPCRRLTCHSNPPESRRAAVSEERRGAGPWENAPCAEVEEMI